MVIICGMMVMAGFNSCSDDDDEDGKVDAKALIGTWMAAEDDFSTYITFNGDHTGSTWIMENGKIDDTFVFNWTLSDKTLVINFMDYYGDLINRLTIISVNSKKLVMNNGEETITFSKVK